MQATQLKTILEDLRSSLRSRCANSVRLEIDPPASKRLLRDWQQRHGFEIPEVLADIFLEVGRRIRFSWSLTWKNVRGLPPEFQALRGGELKPGYDNLRRSFTSKGNLVDGEPDGVTFLNTSFREQGGIVAWGLTSHRVLWCPTSDS